MIKVIINIAHHPSLIIISANSMYLLAFNVIYAVCRGRAVTNVGKTCGPTPCLMLAINKFKLNYLNNVLILI